MNTKKNKLFLWRGGFLFASLFMAGLQLMPTQVHATSSYSIEQTTRKINGVVKDNSGLTMPGVNVTVKGTTTGTITDVDGNFSLDVPENATLVFSYVGYVSQEVPVGRQKQMNVVMKEDTKLMDEVVVIGYGSSRKQDLSMAISTVKVDENMKSRPSNLASILQGQMPGVMVQSGGGDPMKSATLSIRGRGSRGNENDYGSGDAILYVVDGVVGAPFNMEDVETITVLKDAASAAIYGASVGSGGVVVITTKQANSGKVRVSFNLQRGFKSAWKLPQSLTSEQYNKVWKDAAAAYGDAMPREADPTVFPYGNVTRTNWIDEIFRTGTLEHYAVSLSGGNDYIRSFASVSYDHDKGILENTYAKKLGTKLNLDFQLAKWLKASEVLTFQYQNGQGDLGGGHEGVLTNAILFPRSATLYDYDKNGNLLTDERGNPLYHGTVPRWAAEQGFGGGYGELRNPLATLMRLDQERPSYVLYSTSSLELKPISNLTIKSDFTVGLNNSKADIFTPRVPEVGRTNFDNERRITLSTANNWIWETTANYSTILADAHHLSAMAGYTMKYDKAQWQSFGAHTFDLEDRHSTVLSLASAWDKIKPQEEIWEESMISAFARLGYSYNDRYFVTASIRRDATSKLYRDNNSGVFPALSGSWKVSSEKFFAPLKSYINLLKFRASWGQVGNVGLVPRYSWNVPLGVLSYPVIYGKDLNTVITDGVYTESIATKTLKWETTEQIGFGLDLGLFNDEVTLSVDYFDKRTKNLIEKMPIPSVAGITEEPYGNIGSVSNKGWEFSGTFNKRFGEVTVGLNANLSTVKNEVLSLGDRDFLEHSNNVNSIQPLRSVVGQPWYSYALIKTDGIFQTQDEINNYTWTNPKTGIQKIIQPDAQPGDLKYVDANNDGIITPDDKQYMGSFLPTLNYGFGANLAWKGFDFSFLIQGVSGNKIFNGFKQITLTGRQQGGNMLTDILSAWDYDKTSGIPRLGIKSDPNGNYTNPSDFFLEDGSYMRLKNVTLGYTLPKTLMNKTGLTGSNLRIYVSGENLLTATKYSGFDPEVGNFGIDGGVYPVARVVSLGVNFSF